MLAEVVGAHELLVAVRALESLLSRVGAPVPLQLVRAREALATVEPVADEGPLAAVPPEVGAKVRRLAVHLAAAGNVADVLLLARLAVEIPEANTVSFFLKKNFHNQDIFIINLLLQRFMRLFLLLTLISTCRRPCSLGRCRPPSAGASWARPRTGRPRQQQQARPPPLRPSPRRASRPPGSPPPESRSPPEPRATWTGR